MDLDPTKLRARFAELRSQRDKIEGALSPLHDELTKLRDEAKRHESTLVDKIKKARAPLESIDGEMSMISGALRGKTGTPVAPTEEAQS